MVFEVVWIVVRFSGFEVFHQRGCFLEVLIKDQLGSFSFQIPKK